VPFTSDDVRRLLEAAIIDTITAPPEHAPKIAAALAPVLTPALQDLTDEGPRMTAAEALFVRDTVASELQTNGGADIAERLIVAGYIDVEPILAAPPSGAGVVARRGRCDHRPAARPAGQSGYWSGAGGVVTRAAVRPGLTDDHLPCPECGIFRRTPETLRVHRWLAHDWKELPDVR
jgi:hypothetical protein